MQLQNETSQLIDECEQCISRFYEMREQNAVPDFFQDVKPHADRLHVFLHHWQQHAYTWIQQYKPKYIHPRQIDAATEAMNQFIVQSYYKETSKKRFLQSIHAVLYTLQTLLRAIEEAKSE